MVTLRQPLRVSTPWLFYIVLVCLPERLGSWGLLPPVPSPS